MFTGVYFLVYRCSLEEKVSANARNTTLNTLRISFSVVPHLLLVSWELRYDEYGKNYGINYGINYDDIMK